jgi:hypothetical protein
MAAGYSTLRCLEDPKPDFPLSPDESYYLINLHQAQAYFRGSALVKPAFLTLSSVVESPFQPGQPLKSLYQVTTFRKNQSFRLPINVNLSGFLPARTADALRITMRYIVTRDNPFQKLASKIKDVNLVAKISAVSMEMAVAAKVSEVTATLLSYLLQEGGEDTIFELVTDFNVADMKSGYCYLFGSPDEYPKPRVLQLDGNLELYDDEDRLSRFCFAVFKVLTIPVIKEEKARDKAWYELLQAGKDKTLAYLQLGRKQRDAAIREWNATLLHVAELARKDQSFLLKEIRQIIGKAQQEIDGKLISDKQPEAFGDQGYPEEWQKVLGVKDRNQLTTSVRDYQDAMEVVERLLKKFDK